MPRQGIVLSALLLRGFSSIMLQTVLARELLAVFYGNELTLGATFGLWLLFGALGSAVAGPLLCAKAKTPLIPYAVVQVIGGFWGPIALGLVRGGKTLLGLSAGEVLSLGPTLFITAAALGVIALADGILFFLGIRLFTAAFPEQQRPMARLYVLEAAGVVIGAGALTLLLQASFDPFQIAGLVILLNAIAAILLARLAKDRARYLRTLIATTALALLLFSPSLRRSALRLQWPGQELQTDLNSLYGNIAVLKKDGQRTVFYDGLPAITVPHPDAFFAEDFIHLPLLTQPPPRKVLFIGHAAGGPLRELLKHPIEEIVYLELDPLLFDVLRGLKDPGIDGELNDPRVRPEACDARRFIKTTQERFDAVFLYAGLPTSLAANRTATEEAFREIAGILTPSGSVVFTTWGSLVTMNDELKRMNAMALKTCRAALPHCEVLPGDGHNTFIAAGKTPDLTPSRMIQRLQERRLRTHLINPAYISLRLDGTARKWFDEEIRFALEQVSLNQDLRPTGLYEGLSLYYAQFSRKIPKALRALRTRSPAGVAGSLLFVWLGLSLFAARKNKGSAPLSLAVFSTGFFGISVQIATLFLFQSLLGLLYFWLAALTTSFMVGLCVGAVVAGKKRDPARARLALIAAETLLALAPALLLATAIVFYRQPGYFQGIVKGALFASSFSAGLLAGFEVPLVYEVLRAASSNASSEPARLGGRLYALDLAGACLGALVTPLILIPACGLPLLLLLLYLIKAINGLNIACATGRRL